MKFLILGGIPGAQRLFDFLRRESLEEEEEVEE